MRKIQTLGPRSHDSLEEALVASIRFEDKFNKMNSNGKLTFDNTIFIGDSVHTEINIYEL